MSKEPKRHLAQRAHKDVDGGSCIECSCGWCSDWHVNVSDAYREFKDHRQDEEAEQV